MADEQIIIEITVEDEELRKAAEKVDLLTSSIDLMSNRIKEARKENGKYENSIQDVEQQLKEGLITTKEAAKQTTELNNKIHANNVEIAKNSIEISKQKSERSANIKLIKSEVDTLKKLETQATLLNKEISNTKIGSDAYNELKEKLANVNEEINTQRQSFNDTTRNIGNYKKSIVEALSEISALEKKEKELNETLKKANKNTETGLVLWKQTTNDIAKTKAEIKEYREEFGILEKKEGTIQKMLDGFEEIPGATSNAATGVKTLGASFKALLANPVVLMIAAAAAALALLFKAFQKSATGSQLLLKGSAALEGAMGAVIKIAETLAQWLEKLFVDPQAAIEELGEIILNSLINRLEGAWLLIQGLGESVKALITADWDGLAESAEKIGRAFISWQTGLSAEQQKQLATEIENTAIQAAKYAESMIKLVDAQKAVQNSNRNLTKDIANLNAEFEKLSQIAGDDTLSLEEQKKAALEASKIAVELAAKDEQLAKNRLNIINQELTLRRSFGENVTELMNQQTEAQVALTETQSRNTLIQMNNLREQRVIERDIFELRLDQLIDIGDKMKTVGEEQVTNEKLSIEKRKANLNALRIATQSNISEISKEYERYGVTAEQINDLVNSSDAASVVEKLKNLGINEIANNRLREIIMERIQWNLDFNKLDKELSDEQISRTEKANEKIKQTDTDKEIFLLENEEKRLEKTKENEAERLRIAEEIKNKLIEFETEKLELTLANEALLADERIALKKETELKILEIEEEYRLINEEKQVEANANTIERVNENLSKIGELTAKFAGEENRIFTDLTTNISDLFKKQKVSAEDAFGATGLAASSVFNRISALRQKDFTDLEKWQADGLAANEGNAAAQQKIRTEYAKKEKELKEKAFKADKANALVQIAIQTAQAVAKAVAASPLTLGLPFSAIALGIGAVQAGIVASKQMPEFGKGTDNIVKIGGSHASGNDITVVGYDKNGNSQAFGKVEKGEAMPVIPTRLVSSFQNAMLNSKFSTIGRERKFANGTANILNQNQNNSIAQNNSISVRDLETVLKNLNISVSVEDITSAQNKQVQVRNKASI